jgi:hypothetical protein
MRNEKLISMHCSQGIAISELPKHAERQGLTPFAESSLELSRPAWKVDFA